MAEKKKPSTRSKKKSETQELSEEDKLILKQARDVKDIQEAMDEIQKILDKKGCHITINNTSPLNAIEIIVRKNREPVPPIEGQEN